LHVRDDKFIGYKSLVGECEGKSSPFEGQGISRKSVLKRVLKNCVCGLDLLASG
jgi:hypothetical protein